VSSVANWSYTATATIWRKLEGNDEYGDPLGYAEPEQILCDYEGGLSKKLASLGAEIVVKNTVWTEFALAAAGDYLLIGESTDADPVLLVPTRCGRLSAMPTRSIAWRMISRLLRV
jgi:hypothetical protein